MATLYSKRSRGRALLPCPAVPGHSPRVASGGGLVGRHCSSHVVEVLAEECCSAAGCSVNGAVSGGVVLAPGIVFLGRACYPSCLRSRPDRITFLLLRYLSKAEVFPLVFLLGLRKSRTTCAWSKVMELCLAVAWAPRSGRAAARVRARGLGSATRPTAASWARGLS